MAQWSDADQKRSVEEIDVSRLSVEEQQFFSELQACLDGAIGFRVIYANNIFQPTSTYTFDFDDGTQGVSHVDGRVLQWRVDEEVNRLRREGRLTGKRRESGVRSLLQRTYLIEAIVLNMEMI